MADAIVPQSRRQDATTLTNDSRTAEIERSGLPLSPILVFIWAVMVGGIGLFLAFGTVRVGAGNWIGQRLAISEIWSRFLGFLTHQGAAPALILLVAVAAGLTLVLAAFLLWFALALRDQPGEMPDDSQAAR